MNDEVEAAVDAADPDEELFNPVLQAFHGPYTKQVAGVPGISPTFAVDVMCHPLLLALGDRVLLPSCARYQLNLGHLLQRGPGSDEQWLHRDEAGVERRAAPAPRAAARVGDRVRRLHPRERRDPRRPGQPPLARPCAAAGRAVHRGRRPTPEQIAYAEMPAGSAVVYPGGTIHGGGSNTTDVAAPGRAPQLLPRLAAHRGEQLPRRSPPAVAATLPRQAQELLGYAVHDSIPRGGGYLGMVRMQDPVELLARGELTG